MKDTNDYKIRDYSEFLHKKKIHFEGEKIGTVKINDKLFDFQKKIVEKALEKSRCCIFAECGLGKTPILLDWASNVPGKVLVVAPLAVGKQIESESQKFGYDAKFHRIETDIFSKIIITNYDSLHKFDEKNYQAVVLDESSILKNSMGSMRKMITSKFENFQYKLCTTATPAPNDLIELSTQAEFLGVMNIKEIRAMFFIQADGTTSWRLKKHAEKDFWTWISSWSVVLRYPSDLGFSDEGYKLPKLNFIEHVIDHGTIDDGFLFPMEAHTLSEQRIVKKKSMKERVEKAKQIIGDSKESFVVWCELNQESEMLKKTISDSLEIKGSDSVETKENRLMKFINQEVPRLITKPSIAGFGLNLQFCHNLVFMNISHSYERFYQAIRRFWRFGQLSEVNVHLICTKQELSILHNLQRKEKLVKDMMNNIINYFTENGNDFKEKYQSIAQITKEKDYELILGDSIKEIDSIESNSVGLSVFSPPFPSMYSYTDSASDIGNTKNIEEMLAHFRFLLTKDKLMRVMMPGRNVCIHLTQTPQFKHEHGFVGMEDFRGKVIQMMQQEGWIYYSEVTIDKNPQYKAIRTKDASLSFRGLVNDSAMNRPAMADYLLIFKKKGDNPNPIKAGTIKKYNAIGWVTDEQWISWAAPVWKMNSNEIKETELKVELVPNNTWNDISETNVLNVRQGKDEKDEKHLCPLQLDVIERCVLLYTNPCEIVFSPFAGIGSEGHTAIVNNRRFIGIELKESYYKEALKNLKIAKEKKEEVFLF